MADLFLPNAELVINNIKGILKMGMRDKLKEKLAQAKEAINTKFADQETIDSRLSICNSCELLTITRNCRKCGCFVDGKARLAGQQCPLNKW